MAIDTSLELQAAFWDLSFWYLQQPDSSHSRLLAVVQLWSVEVLVPLGAGSSTCCLQSLRWRLLDIIWMLAIQTYM